MKLTTKRYGTMLSVQSFLFFVDFLINIVSVLTIQNHGMALILFIIQTAGLVMSLGTLFMTFFSTYAFQAGLIDLLYEKFHVSVIVFLLYFVMTIIVQIWFLVVHWNNTNKLIFSSTPLFVVFILQRLLTPIYYYFYKRTSLRISDPRLYEDVWNENVPK